jgi:hypothetical protein
VLVTGADQTDAIRALFTSGAKSSRNLLEFLEPMDSCNYEKCHLRGSALDHGCFGQRGCGRNADRVEGVVRAGGRATCHPQHMPHRWRPFLLTMQGFQWAIGMPLSLLEPHGGTPSRLASLQTAALVCPRPSQTFLELHRTFHHPSKSRTLISSSLGASPIFCNNARIREHHPRSPPPSPEQCCTLL